MSIVKRPCICATMISAMTVVIMKDVGLSVARPAHPGSTVPVFLRSVRMDRSISRQTISAMISTMPSASIRDGVLAVTEGPSLMPPKASRSECQNNEIHGTQWGAPHWSRDFRRCRRRCASPISPRVRRRLDVPRSAAHQAGRERPAPAGPAPHFWGSAAWRRHGIETLHGVSYVIRYLRD